MNEYAYNIVEYMYMHMIQIAQPSVWPVVLGAEEHVWQLAQCLLAGRPATALPAGELLDEHLCYLPGGENVHVSLGHVHLHIVTDILTSSIWSPSLSLPVACAAPPLVIWVSN